MKTFLNKKINLIYCILILFACVLLVFTNFSYDAEYQMSLSYRALKGDILIEEMWEPHQTSSFLCAAVMKLFILITGGTTGIVVFTQAAGLLMRGAISLYLYHILRRHTDQIPAAIAGVLYLLTSPKDLLVPDFSNMQLWFATLMALTLIHYFDTNKQRYLILSASCLCLGVLSYPSYIIAYFGALCLLWHYSSTPKKDLLIYTGTCALIGGVFVLYLLSQASVELIFTIVPLALSIEPTHTVSMSGKIGGHIIGLLKMTILPTCTIIVGFLIERLVALFHPTKTTKKANINIDKCLLFAWLLMMIYFFINILKAENNGSTSYPIFMLIALSLAMTGHMASTEKRAYFCGFWISVMNLLTTLLLSDHPAIHAFPYMVIAVCFSALPLYRWFQKCADDLCLKKLFLCAIHIFLIATIFRCIYVHIPISGRGQMCSLASDLALIRSGPAMGLITNEEGAAKQRDSYIEFQEYIKPGDTIWLLGDPLDTLGYLYVDVEVGAPSVMSTPTYNEDILYYWELNPEKYPDVIILQSGFGELSWELLKNNWLMCWLEEEYQAETIIDGNYWRYYFKEKQEKE